MREPSVILSQVHFGLGFGSLSACRNPKFSAATAAAVVQLRQRADGWRTDWVDPLWRGIESIWRRRRSCFCWVVCRLVRSLWRLDCNTLFRLLVC